MASGDNQAISSFPPPPMAYISKYTDDNIRLGRAPRPPPPIKDSYWMFGAEYKVDDHIVRPLESQSLQRLYPHNYDHKRELKKLNFSILVNFLDLLDVLVKAPESRRRLEKIDDLSLLFIHMHHLINEFRPHQARETLRVMLERQKQQRLELAEKIDKCNDQVGQLLNATVLSIPDDDLIETKPLSSELHSSFFSSGVQSTINPGNQRGSEHTKTNTVSSNNDVDMESDFRDEMMCNIVDNLN